MTSPLIAALLAERSGYVARDLPERVAAVDSQLARLGHTRPSELPPGSVPETTALAGPPETATPPRPQPRRSNSRAQ